MGRGEAAAVGEAVRPAPVVEAAAARVTVEEPEFDTELVAGFRCRVEWDGPVRTVYHPTGELWKRERYENGVLHGKQTVWNPDGNLAGEFELRNGTRHGPGTLYGEKGVIVAQGLYAYGYRTGRWVEYYPSGDLRSRGDWIVVTRNGAASGQLRVGDWEFWGKKGELLASVSGRYVDGKLDEPEPDPEDEASVLRRVTNKTQW